MPPWILRICPLQPTNSEMFNTLKHLVNQAEYSIIFGSWVTVTHAAAIDGK